MHKLPIRLQLLLLGLLATSLVFLALVVFKISSVTTASENYAEAQMRVLSNISSSELNARLVGKTVLTPLVQASPLVSNTYAETLDHRGIATASAGLATKTASSDVIEYLVPLKGNSDEFAEIRFAIDLRLATVAKAAVSDMVIYTIPAVALIVFYSLLLMRSRMPTINSFKLINKAFQFVPHDSSLVARKPGVNENNHNLKLLIVSLHKHVKTLRDDCAMLNTSTKVLAYQKINSESILRSAPQGVLVLDETGQVSFVNQQFLRWYRLESEQVLGKSPSEWCEGSEMKTFLNRYRGSVARRAESGAAEFDPPGKPGTYLSMTAYPMFSSKTEEHIQSTLVVFSDTTTEVQAQKAREDFAIAAAHELKTPLHAIGMHAEMLLTEDGEDKSLRVESANFINTEVAHIGELVRNMLSITRIEIGNLSINRELTKLDDLLDTLISSIETNASENNITIVKDYQKGMEPCFLDKDLLRVALNNLLSNAVKYNIPGGEVKVIVVESEHKLKLTVSDTGLGIGEDEKSRVFEKFFRSEDSRIREVSGHGLGLSLVKEIIELHSGTISVESTIGKGTDFTVRLKKINVPLKEAA